MEQAITVAAKLYKCRDSARLLLGERYKEKMADYGGAINRVAAKLQCGTLEAAKCIAEKTEDGMIQMLVFAAAVELTEPSNTRI